MSEFHYGYFMNEIEKSNTRVYKALKDYTTREDLIRVGLTFAQEPASPPDTLPKPGVSKEKLEPNSYMYNILRIYSGLPDSEFSTLTIAGSVVPVLSKECKMFKALMLATVSSNEQMVEEVSVIVPTILQNLATKQHLAKGFVVKDLTYYQKSAIQAIRSLYSLKEEVSSFSAEDLEDIANNTIEM